MTMTNLVTKHQYYNNAFFARWAKLYDYEKYLLFPLRQKAARFLNLPAPQKVLDVATGTGAQAYELAKLGHNVVGIDLSPEMLAQAKKKLTPSLHLRFLQADGTKLPFKNGIFDVSSISLGLHDMPHEIDLLVLKEMKRVTKKNGIILIVDYMEPKKHWVAKLIYPLIRAYETPNYVPFVTRGFDDLLARVDLSSFRTTNFLGLAQIILVKNNK